MEQEYYASRVVALTSQESALELDEDERRFQEKLEKLRVEVAKRENQRKFEQAKQ